MRFSTLQNYAKVLLYSDTPFSKQSSCRCSCRSGSNSDEHTHGPIMDLPRRAVCLCTGVGPGCRVQQQTRPGTLSSALFDSEPGKNLNVKV